MRAALRGLTLASTLVLAACAGRQPAPAPVIPQTSVPSPAKPEPVAPPAYNNAVAAGVQRVAPVTLNADEAERALNAFKRSCSALQTRVDTSGLTKAGEWAALCNEAGMVPATASPAFFTERFDWVQIGDGVAFATGYYEAEIQGSRTRQAGYGIPIYAKPADLVRCTRADGTTGRGRIDESGSCVAYFDRAAIEDGALTGRATEIAWAADPVELFFLEIQGSGRLHLPDGGIIRIGYADQNGLPYTAVGKLLRQRNLLPQGGATAEGIKAWMRAQPDGGKALMRENQSYIFFRELTGPGPLGAMNVAVTPQVSVAADPSFVPLGAPVFLTLDGVPGRQMWVAQDTGGAIKGANRFDTFWGAGEAAKEFAGGLSSKGRAVLLLPKESVARLMASNASARP